MMKEIEAASTKNIAFKGQNLRLKGIRPLLDSAENPRLLMETLLASMKHTSAAALRDQISSTYHNEDLSSMETAARLSISNIMNTQ